MTRVVWGDERAVRARLEAELDRLLGVLAGMPDVEQVWVTGSLVEGGLHGGSDIDLLVVRRTEQGPVERAVSLSRLLAPRVGLDLFVYTPEELARGGRFLDYVKRKGRRVR